jgi:hypothetical protein
VVRFGRCLERAFDATGFCAGQTIVTGARPGMGKRLQVGSPNRRIQANLTVCKSRPKNIRTVGQKRSDRIDNPVSAA